MTHVRRVAQSYWSDNVVELERGETLERRVRPWLHITWIVVAIPPALDFVNNALSLAGYPGLPSVPSPGVGTRSWVVHGAALMLWSISLLLLYGQYRRLQHYNAALPFLHKVGHQLRELMSESVVSEMQGEANAVATSAEGNVTRRSMPTTARVLRDLLTQTRLAFERLADRGEIHATLMLPSGRRPGAGSKYLDVTIWSSTRDQRLMRQRRIKAAQHRASRLTTSGSLAGHAYEKSRSVLVRDMRTFLSSEKRPVPFETTQDTRAKPETLKYVGSHISVPVVLDERPFGVLCIDSSAPNDFHSDYLEVARLCADLLAIPLKLAGHARAAGREVSVAP